MASVCEVAAMASSRCHCLTHTITLARPISLLQPCTHYRYSEAQMMVPRFPSCSSVKNEIRSDNFTAAKMKKRTENSKKRKEKAAAKELMKEVKHEERILDAEEFKEPDNETIRAELRKKLSLLHPNAYKMKFTFGSSYPASYSLGIDLGDERTGIAISKGFAPRPIEVVELKGQKLADHLIKIAEREKVNEFILGLPKSSSGVEGKQCNKVRHFAGRLAVVAAQRGCCVYLYNEFGSSCDALDYMLMMGSTKKARRKQLDAYAAVVLLQSYFENDGKNVELVVPKRLSLQQLLCDGPTLVDSDDDCDFEHEDLHQF